MAQSPNESHLGQGQSALPAPEALPPAPQPDAGNPAGQYPAQAPLSPPAQGLDKGFKVPPGLNPAAWWTGAAAAAGAYIALLLVSLVATLLLVIGLAASGSGDSLAVPDNPIVSDGDLPSPGSILFQFAAQLPALGMLGSLGAKINADLGMFGQINAMVGVFAMPLLITAAGIAALFIAGRVAERRLPSATRLQRTLQAVVSGVAFSLLLNLVATVAAVRISTGQDMAFSLNAANFSSITVAFVVGAVASYTGRSSLQAIVPGSVKRAFGLSLLRDVGRTVCVHLSIFLVVAIPVAVIVLAVKGGWAAALSAPLWAPTVGLLLFGLGHLAAFGTVSAAGMGSGSGLGSSNFGYGVGGSLAEFGLPVWAGWLLVLVALVAIIAAATYWYLRRGVKDPASVLGWTALPVAFFVTGAFLLWLTGIHATFVVGNGNASQGGGGGISIGLAWWTPFLLLLWGVATEVASRFLAPLLAPLLPGKLVSRIQKSPSVLSLPRKENSGTAALGMAAPWSTAPGSSPGSLSGGTAAAHAGEPGPAPASVGHAGPAVPERPAAPPASALGTPGPPVLVEHTPLSKKAKRNLALAGGAVGLIVVLVGGGAITVNAVRGANGPDKIVQGYLGALVDGNAEQALEIADPNIPNARRVLMTNEIYGKATDRPDGFTVLNTTVTENVATVAVELRQNGAKSEVGYRLAKVNPTLLNDNWVLQDVDTNTVAVTAGSELSTILVNGVEVSVGGLAEGAQSFYPLPAFPGTYEISLPATSKFITAEPVSVVASIGDGGMPASAQLSAKTNAAFDTAVQEKVSTMLKTCAEQKTLKPEGCPFSAYEYSDTRNVAWKITKEPTFEIYSYETNSWQLSTDEVGEASASYERDKSYGSDDPEWEAKTDDARIYLRGVVTMNDDELTVEFSN